MVQLAKPGGRGSPVAVQAMLETPARGPTARAVFLFGQVAQLVEHTTENRGVGGSIPPLATGLVGRSGLVSGARSG